MHISATESAAEPEEKVNEDLAALFKEFDANVAFATAIAFERQRNYRACGRKMEDRPR